MKFNTILLFFLLCSFSAFSQLKQLTRYELDRKSGDDFFTVISAGNEGLIVIQETDEYEKGQGNTWKAILLDTLMQERFRYDLAIESTYIFRGYDFNNGIFYMLFRHDEGLKSDFHLITLHVATGDLKRYDIKNEIELELSHMIVVGERVVLAGYVRYSPTLVSLTMGEDNLSVIPGYFKDRSDVIDLRANHNSTFNVLTREKNYDGYYLRMRTYSPEGRILFEKEIEVPFDYRVVDAKTTDFVSGNIAVVGTFSRGSTSSSQGIFFTIVQPEGKREKMIYFGYGDLEHFFDYMGEKRSARVRRRVERKKQRGKDFNYSSKLLLHQVREEQDAYIIAAEIYDPEFERYQDPSMFSPYYDPRGFNRYNSFSQQRYVRRPYGYQGPHEPNHFKYLETIIVKLNDEGHLLWDNSFAIEEVESNSLEAVTDYNVKGNDISMIYKSDEKLAYKIAEGSESIVEDADEMALLYENDELDHEYEGVGGVSHWYNDTFFVWGYQKVQNKKNEAVDNRRSVIYINKVEIDKTLQNEQ
ncbi:hypothetical protein LVD15_17830 [Fulvivirga maritima]|uniref:hypothetical protein n=1 Tax=Fulvivirga maritima TaxID=2904247 RepID=UPI001F307539|nr:hypothetical protein [Fulvivirga maritima]UII25156.1 hypothetical protein LVD15_17830 [Fulvivirga maritima]